MEDGYEFVWTPILTLTLTDLTSQLAAGQYIRGGLRLESSAIVRKLPCFAVYECVARSTPFTDKCEPPPFAPPVDYRGRDGVTHLYYAR